MYTTVASDWLLSSHAEVIGKIETGQVAGGPMGKGFAVMSEKGSSGWGSMW